MIANDQVMHVTLDRVAGFSRQLAHMRRAEPNPANYRAAASGFLAEIERMQREVREYLSLHPAEVADAA